MKKPHFILGLCTGVVLTACSAAFALDSLQAVLFPSKIHFLMNGAVKEMDGSGDDAIINYNNKTYVPLRSFAEFMDASVQYRYAAPETNDKHIIDIYSGFSEAEFSTRDPEGYVSLARLKKELPVSQTAKGDVRITGILRVDKDLAGKKVQLDALDKQGNVIGSTDIDMFNHLHLGSIANLNNLIYVRGEVDSLQVRVKDTWALTTREEFRDGILEEPAGLVFGKEGIDAEKKGLVQTLQFKNQFDRTIIIEPLAIEYQITKAGEKEEEPPLLSVKLAPLEGRVPTFGWYEAKLPVWNLRVANGAPVSPGTYVARIKVPDSIAYTVEGSNEVKTLAGSSLSRFTEWEYDITQEEIDRAAGGVE